MATGRRNIAVIGAIVAAAAIGVGVASYSFSTSQPVIQAAPTENNSVTFAVLNADATVGGLTYGELTASWWQSRLGIEESRNPIVDTTGEYCHVGQSGEVWFLDGNFGGLTERTCTIPADRHVLFPVINSLCDYAEYPDLNTEAELRECARSANDGAEVMVKINGEEIDKSQIERIESPLFNLTLPEDNILGLAPQTTQAVADGFWGLLEPLPKGSHVIEYTGSVSDFTAGSTNNFVTSSKYQITIE